LTALNVIFIHRITRRCCISKPWSWGNSRPNTHSSRKTAAYGTGKLLESFQRYEWFLPCHSLC